MAKRAKSANAGEPKSRTGTGKKRLNLVLVSVTLRSPGASMQPLQQSAGICPESLVGPSWIRGLAGGAIPISPPAAFAPAQPDRAGSATCSEP